MVQPPQTDQGRTHHTPATHGTEAPSINRESEQGMILIKLLIVFILILPATLLTGLIWLFGGWRDGFDYMPNPAYALVNWWMA